MQNSPKKCFSRETANWFPQGGLTGEQAAAAQQARHVFLHVAHVLDGVEGAGVEALDEGGDLGKVTPLADGPLVGQRLFWCGSRPLLGRPNTHALRVAFPHLMPLEKRCRYCSESSIRE